MVEWHHAPPHRFEESGIYFITGSTHLKQHILRSSEKLELFSTILFGYLEAFDLELDAWAIFSNHYHLIVRTSADPKGISTAIARTHSLSSNRLNELDATRGRKVWFQFRDTQLTREKSYLARLKYVQQNPVHHRLVRVASRYPWCSAGWFEAKADREFQRKLDTFSIDRLNASDDYEPVLDDSTDQD